ncbi:NAD(P)/FAD-dependent oxidoreductase [Pelagibacterium sp.]|uniref:NAD(P)/FAD-dependent oxidoreductase n=1 Tax=Pelagibacterium sp. TaxID=1967288 RepID=UPI003C7B21DC
MEQVIIVGGGQTGMNAAVSMRQSGFEGSILIVGEEEALPYERPPLSKEWLKSDVEPNVPLVCKRDMLEDLHITFQGSAAVTSISPEKHQITLLSGEVLDYDALLLSTGGRVRPLPIEGAEYANCLRTLDDARALRAKLHSRPHVTCIGAGVIGLETAATARELGCEVTVIDPAAQPMSRCLTSEGTAFVENIHRRAGVDLRLGVKPVAIRPDDSALQVTCDDGTSILTGCVIGGIGIVRNTELASAAGLEVRAGIVVDEYGRTSSPDIYAAGDVAEFYFPPAQKHLTRESWRHAQNHGIAVGAAMVGMAQPYSDLQWFWTDQHGVRIEVGGSLDQIDRTYRRGTPKEGFILFHFRRGNFVGYTAANARAEGRYAEKLLSKNTTPDPQILEDTRIPLKTLL